MARTVPSGLVSHLAAGSAHLVQCIKIIRKDGTIERYTESDIDGTVAGEAYTSHDSLQIGSCPFGLDGFSSGFDITFGADDTTSPSSDDIRDGAYDAAEVELRTYDAVNPGLGSTYLAWGRVATVDRRVEGSARMAVKGLLAQSHQILVERYMPMCIWMFCDDRCGLDPAAYTFTGTITSLGDGYNFTVSGAIAGRPENAFKDGVFEITSGLRAGVWGIEMLASSGGSLRSALDLPRGVQAGDTISALQGCGKRRVDCKAYGNYARFGGFPDAGSPTEAASISYIDWPAA